MKYIVRIIDQQDKQIDVNLEEQEVSKFLEFVREDKISWDSEEKNFGFYINPKNVRFMQIFKVKEEAIVPVKEESVSPCEQEQV